MRRSKMILYYISFIEFVDYIKINEDLCHVMEMVRYSFGIFLCDPRIRKEELMDFSSDNYKIMPF